MNGDWDPWDHRPPIRSERGIRSRRGKAEGGAWSRRWLEAIAALAPQQAGRLSRGRGYARQGQVLELEEGKGGLSALVQGSRPRPYRVRISLSPIVARRGGPLLQRLAQGSASLAALLAGELSDDVAEAFAHGDTPLLPGEAGDLDQSCDCPDPASPCKHLIAVHALLADRLDDDPLLLLRLRGLDPGALIDELRRLSGAGAGPEDPDGQPGDAAAGVPAVDGAQAGSAGHDELASLHDVVDDYWELGRSLRQATPAPPQPPPVSLPILRRLGQPDFLEEDLARFLGPAIRRAAEAARRLAEGDWPEAPGGSPAA